MYVRGSPAIRDHLLRLIVARPRGVQSTRRYYVLFILSHAPVSPVTVRQLARLTDRGTVHNTVPSCDRVVRVGRDQGKPGESRGRKATKLQRVSPTSDASRATERNEHRDATMDPRLRPTAARASVPAPAKLHTPPESDRQRHYIAGATLQEMGSPTGDRVCLGKHISFPVTTFHRVLALFAFCALAFTVGCGCLGYFRLEGVRSAAAAGIPHIIIEDHQETDARHSARLEIRVQHAH